MLIQKKLIIKVAIVLLLLTGLVLFYISRPKTALLTIESIPKTQIYIDGEYKGDTPREIEVSPGDRLLKLQPVDQNQSYSNYETRVKTVAGVKTIVRRILGGEEEKASGEIISFKKASSSSADFSIISTPDAASVFIDNKFIDSTPLKVTDLSPGVHKIQIKAQGYESREFEIQIIQGYKLTAIVALARLNDTSSFLPSNLIQNETSDDNTSDNETQKLKILSTPTDYLRVRELPTTNSKEIGQARPGQTYEYIETSEDKLWHKIVFQDDTIGWVSSEYSELLNNRSTTGSGI